MSDAPPPTPDAAEDYWTQSRQPLASLALVAPALVVYELGVLLMGPHVRNGVDHWLRRLLEIVDFRQYFLLPVLTVAILLGWQYVSRRPWRISPGVLPAMAVESALLGGCLWLVLQFYLRAFSGLAESFARPVALAVAAAAVPERLISFLGAGIYEELLFRLILLSLVGWGLMRLHVSRRASIITAVLATSLAFAAAHYVADRVAVRELAFWFGFSFRFIAGVFFSVLFVARGFGIAAGAHACYDILAVLTR